jgi:hypothetical protein
MHSRDASKATGIRAAIPDFNTRGRGELQARNRRQAGNERVVSTDAVDTHLTSARARRCVSIAIAGQVCVGNAIQPHEG